MLLPAASATTRNSPARCSTTFNVLQPIEPVEPSMEIDFIKIKKSREKIITDARLLEFTGQPEKKRKIFQTFFARRESYTYGLNFYENFS